MKFGVPDYTPEEEELKIVQNRRKYKQEQNGVITTSHRFKRFNQIHVRDNDPVNIVTYPKYYLKYIEGEKEKLI